MATFASFLCLSPGPTRIVVVRVCVAVCLVGGFVGCGRLPTPPQSGEPIAVHQVVDGDTISIALSNGTTETVRLLGVDTPETVDPSRPRQCFGAEASSFVAAVIPPGTEIIVERDTEARDHYGRLLAYIYRASDGLFVNEAILLHGFADISIYEPNSTHEPRLHAAVTQARTANIGLWQHCGGADVAIDPPPLAVS